VCFVLFPLSPPLIRVISQQGNKIGADGARAVADFMRGNSSVQLLDLVRMCCSCIVAHVFFPVFFVFCFISSISTSHSHYLTD
jgi:hypothetical protein